MLFVFFLALCYSINDEKDTKSQITDTIQDIKSLSSKISSIQFDSNDLTEQIDKDAINLALEEIKVTKNSNFFSKFLKNSDDNYLKYKCYNCIKILSQNATFVFRAIRKSTINTVNFYLRPEDTCSIKDIQLFFYNDNSLNYTSEVYHLKPKTLNSFRFNQDITFENVKLNATSDNPSLLCLNGFSLLVR